LKKFSEALNPYDFANPVSNPELFAGRRAELSSIVYYLDLARSSRPIGLALVGPRAAGKTSLLNILAREAGRRDFCVVRVDLDESDAATPTKFFFRVFDELVTAAVGGHDAYGGIKGKTYQTYQEMMFAHIVPEDRLLCPFLFPMQYAQAASSQALEHVELDSAFAKDLEAIRAELGKPIAILLDECDVISNNRSILQKLRNIFMRNDGTLLVLVGTSTLTEQLDDVFSPILRGFKPIEVCGFDDMRDTEECIRKPLESLGIENPFDIFDFESYQDTLAIHRLTAGTPYEIQLLCHVLFRRVQSGKDAVMQLSVEALHEVLSELMAGGSRRSRARLSDLSKLGESQLAALVLCAACEEGAAEEDLWFWEFFVNGVSRFSREDFSHYVEELVSLGMLEDIEGRIRFAGIPLERVYVKYYARTKGIDVSVAHSTIRSAFTADIQTRVLELLPGASIAAMTMPELTKLEELREAGQDITNMFCEAPVFAGSYYLACFERPDDTELQFLNVTIRSPWGMHLLSFFCDLQEDREACDSGTILEPLVIRAAEAGGEVNLETRTMQVAPYRQLAVLAVDSGNEEILATLAGRHSTRMHSAYRESHTSGRALRNAEMAALINPSIDNLNNVGYIKLAAGDLDGSRDFLCRAEEKANEVEKDSIPAILPTYNLAIIAALEGDLTSAASLFTKTNERLKRLKDHQRGCSFLFVLETKTDGSLGTVEIIEPDALEAASQCARVVDEAV